jgi:hypothetical protein
MKMNDALALGALMLLSCGPAGAVTLDARLSGAWATSPGDCQKLFVRSGGGLAYRQPPDQFAQAAIITPSSVVLPNQTCQVIGLSHDKGLTKLDFTCRDTISYTSQSVEIEIKSSTEMIYRPNGDKTLDTTMVKCRL